ncbi:hypothetical protein UA45_13380 [Morganella morganii]|uniref:Uncharacterized protein n=1 Tax=Morganella morganii TaxID=582 RepID=A0A0D8L654_MORMO|nr:hypothetical protein UA45_13380 [Morganella morganii]
MSTPENRDFSQYTSNDAKTSLCRLLQANISPEAYQTEMKNLGLLLGESLSHKLSHSGTCLLVSTAEDADYLSLGVIERLQQYHNIKIAVFWNNHYSPVGDISIAPIVHRYLDADYEKSTQLIIIKSIISGSCVVRTNILEVIEKIKAKSIYIVSPVMHEHAEEKLKNEFPVKISKKFQFIYFATDKERDNTTGEVIPGIGGVIYKKLGLTDQPSQTGFIPLLVKQRANLR